MKILFSYAALLVAALLTSRAEAQDKKHTAVKHVKKGAKTVGNKTAELASKGASTVVDKKYKGKMGPHGETVYIDNESRYYYVNKAGKHVYIKVLDLRNRP